MEKNNLNKNSEFKLIKAGLLINGIDKELKENMAILVKNDKIQEVFKLKRVKIPNNIEVIDLTDRTVIPGLIDAHMHFFGVPSFDVKKKFVESPQLRVLRASYEAEQMLKAGITSACCQGSSISLLLKQSINKGYVRGPHIISAGEYICATGGTWDYLDLSRDLMKKSDIFADDIDEVRKKVRKRIRQGADIIKVGLSKGRINDTNHIWGDDPYATVISYSPEEIEALVSEAHSNHIKVSAHCIGDAAVRLALDCGVDIINHGYAISEETRNKILKSKKMIISTIAQIVFHIKSEKEYHYSKKRKEIYRNHLAAMKEDFKRNIELGIEYALGSDLIGYPTHPQDQFAKEFELAVEWGMEPMHAIISGTRNSAKIIGIDSITGTIEPNKIADLVAFKGNPLEDIKVLQNIDFVMKSGQFLFI